VGTHQALSFGCLDRWLVPRRAPRARLAVPAAGRGAAGPVAAGGGRGVRRDRRAAAQVRDAAPCRARCRRRRADRTVQARDAPQDGRKAAGGRGRRRDRRGGRRAGLLVPLPLRRRRSRLARRTPAPARSAPKSHRDAPRSSADRSRPGPPARSPRLPGARTPQLKQPAEQPRNSSDIHPVAIPARALQRGAEPAARAPGTGALLAPRLHGLRVAWRGGNPWAKAPTTAGCPQQRREQPRPRARR
jgi:hypothetical protein